VKRIRIGVVGFGNLGRACVEVISERSCLFELVAVFSRRTVKGTVALSKIEEYKDKIDVLLVCVGSCTDAPVVMPLLVSNFCTVDSFDNHAKLSEYIERIKSSQGEKVSIVGTGWDPGVFSLMRIYFDAILVPLSNSSLKSSQTFWGEGVSLGHSNAVRRIQGVKDAIQFTVPKKDAIEAVRVGEVIGAEKKHKRVCYVVAQKCEQDRIEQEIRTMPNYFAGQEVEINFVSWAEFEKHYRGRFEHGGLVFGNDGKSQMEFKLKLESNPYYTACVMVAYAIACCKLVEEEKYGVYTVADIAPRYLSFENVISKI